MLKKYLSVLILILSLGAVSGQAQDTLSLQAALQIALSQSFNIQFAQQNQQISENNYVRANAGFTPNVGLYAQYSGARSNTRQEFLDGRTQAVNGANTQRQNAGIQLNWRLFDGLEMFYLYDQLGANRQFDALVLQNEMETVIAQVSLSYLRLAQQSRQKQVLQENLQVSAQRLRIAQDRYELGAISKMEMLRAQVDLNNDSAEVIRQEQIIMQEKFALNQLLNRPPTQAFQVEVRLDSSSRQDFSQLKDKIKTQNRQLALTKQQQQQAQYQMQRLKARQLPTLDLDLSYDLLRTESDAGFLRSNRNQGFNYGLTLNYPLFEGHQRRRAIQNQQIVQEQLVSQQEAEINNLENTFAMELQMYESNQALRNLEAYNAEVAQENLEIALERYKLGGISEIEFRDIQLNALAAENRYLVLNYELKMSEINLLRLSGELLQQVKEKP